jgi:peptidoglycan/LPS O-acetylase OafA/YrhL
MRFFRIYPLHIFALLLMIGLEFIKLAGMMSGRMPSTHIPFSSPDTVGDIGLNILLLQSLGFTNHESWNLPAWSISCEAAGYICFAAAASGKMLGSRAFIWVAVPMALICYAVLFAFKGTLDVTYDLGIVRCLAGMMLGVWIYDVSRTPLIARASDHTAGALASIAAACLIVTMCFNQGFVQVCVIPAFVLTILFLQRDCGWVAMALGSAPMRYLGKISYSTYLMQIPVMSVLGIATAHWFKPQAAADTRGAAGSLWIGDVYVVGVVLVVIAVATITYARIEAPWMKYARRHRVPAGGLSLIPESSRQPPKP